MSKLVVDQLEGRASNSNTISIPAPTTLYAPGHVVQVVTNTLSTISVTTTGQTIVDTGLAASITPKSTSSKVYVMSSFNGGIDVNGNGAIWYIYRDSTKIMGQGGTYTASGGSSYGGNALMMLDSPSSTSSVTYKIRMHNQTAGQITRFNTDYSVATGEIATITLMEIAQ